MRNNHLLQFHNAVRKIKRLRKAIAVFAKMLIKWQIKIQARDLPEFLDSNRPGRIKAIVAAMLGRKRMVMLNSMQMVLLSVVTTLALETPPAIYSEFWLIPILF